MAIADAPKKKNQTEKEVIYEPGCIGVTHPSLNCILYVSASQLSKKGEAELAGSMTAVWRRKKQQLMTHFASSSLLFLGRSFLFCPRCEFSLLTFLKRGTCNPTTVCSTLDKSEAQTTLGLTMPFHTGTSSQRGWGLYRADNHTHTHTHVRSHQGKQPSVMFPEATARSCPG